MRNLSFTKLQFSIVTYILEMKPTDEYKASLSNATAFKHEFPKEKSTTAAQIYNVNDKSV
jgi:hypothetical protein